MWTPSIDGRAGPVYRRIAEALADDLGNGVLTAGMRLPTHRDLAYRLGVTVGTISRAYGEAERLGLIGGEVGRGTFVRQPASARGPADADRPPEGHAGGLHQPTEAGTHLWYADGLHRAIQEDDAAAADRFDLSLNYPSDAPLQAVLRTALARIDDSVLTAIGRYQPSNGMRAHREAGVAWLQHLGVEVDADQLIVVPGCQGGLATTFLALCRPGDVVLHEALTWPGLLATTASQGLRTMAVEMDALGLVPEALDAACRDLHPRVLYTMPTLHNPTTAVMPAERRRAVAEVARRHGVVVLEDDVYGFLLDDRPPTIRSCLPELGIYVTSLSKSVAPGLRIGYLVAPEALVPRLASAVRTSVLMTSSVAAHIATETIRSGGAATAANAQRQEARARQRLAAELLDGLDFRTHPFAFHGWLAVPVPWRGDEFMAALLGRGVSVTPGSAFASAAGSREAETHVRLCLCAIKDRQRLATALGIVAEVARDAAPARMPVV